MKQILFVLILLFSFTMQIELKNKTLETVKFKNIKYDPRKIFKTSSIEKCGPGRIYSCDLKGTCSCFPRITTHLFTHLFEKKCLPGFVYDCTYKYSKISFRNYRDCSCKKKNPKCEEGYSYQCWQLPGMFPANSKMKRPIKCQCKKNNDFMKNNKWNSTFISNKN